MRFQNKFGMTNRDMKKPNKSITIGIPRSMLYYKYGILWRKFFEYLGYEVIISPETNKEILGEGVRLATDETCLSVKIFLGHVNWLKDRVDYLFIPRIVSLYKDEQVCVKHMALYDIVRNTFNNIKLITYTVDVNKDKKELIELLEIGLQLTKNPIKAINAYRKAKKVQNQHYKKLLESQKKKLKNKNDNIKILIVCHPYTTYDGLLGKPIIKFLEANNVDLLYSDIVEERTARTLSKKISEDLYWSYHKEFLGALQLYKNKVDGIMYIMTFPCGPDALVIELCQKKIKGKPSMVLTLDELSGEAGLMTRLESFVDILKIKKGKSWL